MQIVCPLYGISLFLPTIINNLGYVSSTAQLMTVPIYIVAAILAVIVAYISDRVGKRSPFILGFLLMMIVGFSMCISTSNPRVVYAGVFIAACAIYPAFPGVISWLCNNLAGSYKRSAGMAIQIGVGNLGGVSPASLLYKVVLVLLVVVDFLSSVLTRISWLSHRPWHPISIDNQIHPDIFSATASNWASYVPASLQL